MRKYMVVERYKPGCIERVYRRFGESGRMLPEGLNYLLNFGKLSSILYFGKIGKLSS